LETIADREKAAKIVIKLALGHANLDAATLRDDALALMRNENRTGLSKVDREEERTKSSTFIQPKCPKCDRSRVRLVRPEAGHYRGQIRGFFFQWRRRFARNAVVVGITIDPSHTISAIKAEFPGRNIAGTRRKPKLT
jgi:hypothetical protein